MFGPSGLGGTADPVVVAGASGRGECEVGGGGGGVPGAVISPVLEDKHGGVVDRAAPGVVFAVWVVLALAVFGSGVAELPEGDRVAAGFSEEVAAVAESMCPFAQPGPGWGEFSAAEFPGGGDHRPVVAVAPECGDVLGGPQRLLGQTRGVEGFGGVFGDVVPDRLDREFAPSAGQAVAAGDRLG